ncbi:GTP diphosphokinase [Alginatibacterium sediminis]|uniref:GTP pyrophosphokinase n=1 Tax=Alginatibacterium sediminis TaxID=2164068 RepID=A0A420ED68_9ALTE|nr:GTP diphosphokinase [Alginatibacterium sediminis]RKF18613.1 GTP diphosphokinase [Alginatibacterium sediminis]
MVSVRETHINQQLQQDDRQWVESLGIEADEQQKLFELCQYLRNVDAPDTQLLNNLSVAKEMVEILQTLNMDLPTLKAAMLFSFVEQELISETSLEKDFSSEVRELQHQAQQMDAMRILQSSSQKQYSADQIDKVRRMLLAIVSDVRSIVIKLAERICHLRSVKDLEEEVRVVVAKECQDIYAPLANRLGIGQLKWELEDFTFRFLHPQTYKQIAKQLDEKRLDRQQYIADFVAQLKQSMQESNIEVEIDGRPKHIYSIYRKMQKKHLAFAELFDVRAIRIVAERLQDCYAALGIVHTNWHHIPSEFDDYVANPKPNGYQSIHTVVVGPEGKTIEIQIRTRKMHEESELGVAAHWKYKEGAVQSGGEYEEKIAWLRKLLAWQDDLSESGSMLDELRSQVFDDRVYVFTPKGEVIDLPKGSTPLDFAYYVHSLVGHRCIGAKVGGRIVPFTYQLHTGEQIEIITQKEPNPSRDWLNPSLGYLSSSRARAKVATWFKKMDRDKNILAGKELLESELSKKGLKLNAAQSQVSKYNLQNFDDLLAAVGAGDIKVNQLIQHIANQAHQPSAEEEDRKALESITRKSEVAAKKNSKGGQIIVEGVGNLMTHVARCCQPIPGDSIQGFITQGRGISVHNQNCEQLAELKLRAPERLIEAVWGSQQSGRYSLSILVVANDRNGLLRDITTVLANDKINVVGMRSQNDERHQLARFEIEVELKHINDLAKVLSSLHQINDVIEARRL